MHKTTPPRFRRNVLIVSLVAKIPVNPLAVVVRSYLFVLGLQEIVFFLWRCRLIVFSDSPSDPDSVLPKIPTRFSLLSRMLQPSSGTLSPRSLR